MKRLFIALWPDMQVRRQLASLQKQMKTSAGLFDGVVAFENLHMTLQFLGDVPVSSVDRIMAGLSTVNSQPFVLTLDSWGHFSRPGILWVGPTEPDRFLSLLQADVVSAIKAGGNAAKEKNFVPHVTLFRKVSHLPEVGAFESVEWLVDRFVLVESHTHRDGVRYRVLQEFLFS